VGIDISSQLTDTAKKMDKNSRHSYRTGDVTKPFVLNPPFTHAAIVLALQNMEDVPAVIANCAANLLDNGTLVIVLNHPAFRIPRQSNWGIDEANKIQFRRINRYLSPLKIPITMHPGQKQSALTWSFHHPISYYVQLLAAHGFVIDAMEEWVSDRESQQGKSAKMENRSRTEIPLFLAIRTRKIDLFNL
jgi:ubiquinone/menaquinone biosynthesis C-methylase UbiE